MIVYTTTTLHGDKTNLTGWDNHSFNLNIKPTIIRCMFDTVSGSALADATISVGNETFRSVGLYVRMGIFTVPISQYNKLVWSHFECLTSWTQLAAFITGSTIIS